MNKLKRRASICVFFILILLVGTTIYIYKQINHGAEWATYEANPHIYKNGRLISGSMVDRNGLPLLKNLEGLETKFSTDNDIAKANVHITGDDAGNIATGANKVFKNKLIGYNFFTGIHTMGKKGRTLTLTIDAKANKLANNALKGKKGTVGLFNYKTGELLIMVSSPNYNPKNPPSFSKDDTSGAYINRLTSGIFVPGSIMKVVTTHCALENKEDLAKWRFPCQRQLVLGDSPTDRITCPYYHGNQDIADAFANSCNCAYGQLTLDLGRKKMAKYTEKAGLTSSYNLDGIETAKGSFDFNTDKVSFAWSGIGQGKSLVNPFSMMVYMGAIGGGGECSLPYIVENVKFPNGLPASFSHSSEKIELIENGTANKLKKLMRNNVMTAYNPSRFRDLKVCAKSGTAESGKNKVPNAWFAGFVDDDKHPYAFIVLVEEGGNGSNVAGDVAAQILSYLY